MSSRKVGYSYLLGILLTLFLVIMLPSAQQVFPWVYDLVPSTLFSEGSILIPALIFMLITPGRLNDMLGFHRIRLRTVFWSILLLLSLFPAVEFISLLSQFFAENAVSEVVSNSLGVVPFPVGLFIIGILGPFVEEVIYRGYFYHTFRLTGRVAASVILSGLLFGLMHMNLNQACYAAFLGFFLALAVEATGSLWTSILIHMTFNSIETVVMYGSLPLLEDSEVLGGADVSMQALTEEYPEMAQVLGILGGIAVLGILLALLILNKMAALQERRPLFFVKKEEKAENTERSGARMLSIPLILGMAITVAYIILFDLMR